MCASDSHARAAKLKRGSFATDIAIATYIQRVEKRPLPVIAFVHESVGREGIRDLLHLNPISFADESEVLAALPKLLEAWKTLPTSGIRVELQSGSGSTEGGHRIRHLFINLINDSSQRIESFNAHVRVPVGILKHWTDTYPVEVKLGDERYRHFRFDEKFRGEIPPRTTQPLITFNYCTRCAVNHTGEVAVLGEVFVAESVVEATVWIDGREYSVAKTIKELSEEAEARGAG